MVGKLSLNMAVLVLLLALVSCKRKTVAGTVYSKHNVPLEGASVEFGYSRGGKNQVDGYWNVTTNKDGKFTFEYKERRNTNVEMVSVSHPDSGSVSLNRGQFSLTSNMEIWLK